MLRIKKLLFIGLILFFVVLGFQKQIYAEQLNNSVKGPSTNSYQYQLARLPLDLPNILRTVCASTAPPRGRALY